MINIYQKNYHELFIVKNYWLIITHYYGGGGRIVENYPFFLWTNQILVYKPMHADHNSWFTVPENAHFGIHYLLPLLNFR